ncbi:MAG: hypothetical protein JW940_04675, partial [Polyangiaceae bacterium]|nr:hypothetical protein [Polyangiaceae bacterium]
SAPSNEGPVAEAASAPLSEGSAAVEVTWEAGPGGVTAKAEPGDSTIAQVVSAPPEARAAAEPMQSTRARSASGAKRWTVVVLLLLLGAAAIGFGLMRGKPTAKSRGPAPSRVSAAPQASPTPAPSPTAPAASAAVSADAAAPAGNTHVELNVRPIGALVFDGSTRLGAAPLSIEIEFGQTRTLQVIARGYMARKIVLDGSVEQVDIALKPFKSANAKTNKAR